MTKKQALKLCRIVVAQRAQIVRSAKTWAVALTANDGTNLMRYDYDTACADLKSRGMIC